MAKTEDDILKLADDWIQLSGSTDDSETQNDRSEAYDYYYGKPFGNERKDRSDYVSRDEFDAVEDLKEMMLEVFASNRETIKFTPRDENDVLQAKLRTSYSNRVFHQHNSGYTTLHDSIQTGLLAKNACAKVYRDEWDEVEKETAEATPEQYAVLEQAEEAGELEILSAEQDEETGMIEVELKRDTKKSKTIVEILRPENVVRDPSAVSPQKARFWGEWSDVTRSDLLEMGFDEGKIENLSNDGDDSAGDVEEQSRRDSGHTEHDEIGEKSQDMFQLYELWMKFDNDDDGIAELYQVFKVGDTLLEMTEQKRMPYFDWQAFRVAHRYEGLSVHDILGDIQKLKSTIKRQIVDNLMQSNNQSRIARMGAFKNPATLIENEFGAIHWVKDDVKNPNRPLADLVQDNPSPQLSPLTLPAVEMLNEDKEHRVGASRLTAGLNQAVVSNQNADDMINRMTSAAMRRVMGMARRYAELFLIPIFQEIYQLGLEHDKEGLMAEVDGEWNQLVPQEMGDAVDMEVSTALTPDDSEAQARTLLVLHNSLMQSMQFDPGTAALYTPQNRYALLREVFKLSGQPMPQYLTDPQSDVAGLTQQLQQLTQQMQQLQQQNQQMQFALQQVNQAELSVKQQDAMTRATKAQGELALKAEKQRQDHGIDRGKLDLDKDAEAHDQMMDEAELVTSTRRPATTGGFR